MPNNNPQQSSSQQRSEGASKVSERVEKTAEQASKLADRLGQTAEQTATAALDRVRDARMQAQSGLEEQRAQIADRIRRLGGVLRAGSETLSTDDPYAQNLLTTAGDRVERLADYVNDLEPGRVVEDLNSFARRHPGMFFGSAFLIGLGLGRFAKSSARMATGGTRNLTSDTDMYGESEYQGSSTTQQYDRTVGTQGTSGSTTAQGTGASYGASGSSGTTLPYGVGSGTTGTSGTGGSQSASSSGTGSSGSAFGVTGSTESQNSTTTSTPRETDRGQGSKS